MGNTGTVRRGEVSCPWLVLISVILLYELGLWDDLQQRRRERGLSTRCSPAPAPPASSPFSFPSIRFTLHSSEAHFGGLL